MLGEQPVQALRRDVEALKIAFYRLRRAEVEAARRRFIEEGAPRRSSRPPWTAPRCSSRSLFRGVPPPPRRVHRRTGGREGEEPRDETRDHRGELKELVDSDETLNHTFTKFRELQQRWKETGIVPQQHVKDLWETYNLHVENFYNFIKINKEPARPGPEEELRAETRPLRAGRGAGAGAVGGGGVPQVAEGSHDEWRETGPVANEYKEALWERFKAASSRINKQHQEHFEALKAEQVRNLELKTGLCEATEEAGRATFHRAQGVEPGERPAARDTEDMEDDRVRPEKG